MIASSIGWLTDFASELFRQPRCGYLRMTAVDAYRTCRTSVFAARLLYPADPTSLVA